MFVDSHLHLDFDEFEGDRDAVLARAAAAGVSAFLTIGVRVRDFGRVLRVAEAYPNVWCAVGTLPHYAEDEADVTVDEIVAQARHPKVVGIGECGLDRLYGSADWQIQQQVLRRHIEAARITGLPLILHSVREDETMARILTEEHAKGAFDILVHAFSGGPVLAEAVLPLGGYFAYGGLLTFSENGAQRELAKTIPLDRLLVETDSPSLAPAPLGEVRNEPANIRHVTRLLAQLKGIDEAELARRTTENFYRLFSRIVQPT